MVWYVYLTRFIAGLSLANGVPHFVNGNPVGDFKAPFLLRLAWVNHPRW